MHHTDIIISFILNIYINNLIIYEISDQPSISKFQLHVKTISLRLDTKSKV